MAHVRLKWLKIEKYRNVAPGTELRFSEGFNVLLGKNGTGKTTLLKLIAMIVRDDLSPLAAGPCDISYAFALPGVTVDVRVKNEQVPPALLPDEPQFSYSYEASAKLDGNEKSYRASGSPSKFQYFVDGEPIDKKPALQPRSPLGPQFLGILLNLFGLDLEFLGHEGASFRGAGQLMLASANRGRFDEGLGGFLALTEGDTDSAREDLRAAQVHFVVDSSGKLLSGGLAFASDEIVRAIGPKELNETIPLQHTELGFLQAVVTAMDFRDAVLLMRRWKKTVDSSTGEQRVTYARFEFNFTLRDGEIITHKDLSYGQKRLLSFLYYVAANPDIIIADELMNGMHRDWAQLCVDEIIGHQSFLAGQDPLLFDFLSFESEDDVAKSFILCTLEPRDGRGHFVWKNLDPKTAASFYRAYEAGIQHVSEILYTKGLW